MPTDVRSYIDQPSAFARRPENVLDGTVGLTVAFREDVLTLALKHTLPQCLAELRIERYGQSLAVLCECPLYGQ